MGDPGRPRDYVSAVADDQWMLDRWTPTEAHKLTVVYRDQTVLGVTERAYVCRCACGWRSIEYVNASLQACPVGEALAERERRKVKPTRHVEWHPYTPDRVPVDKP